MADDQRRRRGIIVINVGSTNSGFEAIVCILYPLYIGKQKGYVSYVYILKETHEHIFGKEKWVILIANTNQCDESMYVHV